MRILSSENLAYSHLQIALAMKDETVALFVKNEPSSRKVCTFDTRRRDVLLLDMISEKTLICKLSNTDYNGNDKSYWTFMNINGHVEEMPARLAELLNEDDWTQLQTKQITTKEFGISAANSSKIIVVS